MRTSESGDRVLIDLDMINRYVSISHSREARDRTRAVTISLSGRAPNTDADRASSQDVSRALACAAGRIVLAAALEGRRLPRTRIDRRSSARRARNRGASSSPLAAEGLDGCTTRTPPKRQAASGQAMRHRGSGPADAGRDAAGRDPLEPSLDGEGERPRALDQSHLAGLRLAAASLGDLQAVERSLLRGEGPRHRRSVFGPPDRALVLCVDEKSQIQALDRPAPLADAPRAGGAAQPRLQVATARPLSSRPSTSRERSSANVSRAIGPESSANSSTSSRRTSLLISTSTSSWTTTGPTRPRRSATGSPNGRAGRPISRPPAPPG